MLKAYLNVESIKDQNIQVCLLLWENLGGCFWQFINILPGKPVERHIFIIQIATALAQPANMETIYSNTEILN